MVGRKKDIEQNGTIMEAHGYDIIDTTSGKWTTRTRDDIRKNKHTKVEAEILKGYVKFLNTLHSERNKDFDFQIPGDPLYPEFEECIECRPKGKQPVFDQSVMEAPDMEIDQPTDVPPQETQEETTTPMTNAEPSQEETLIETEQTPDLPTKTTASEPKKCRAL